jgi:hypothetical protein
MTHFDRPPSSTRWPLLAMLAMTLPSASAVEPTSWNFSVLLDGRPVGTHRFELAAAEGNARSLKSDARFEVKILGFTAYRYRHQADEVWNGDCLASINANTDDDGAVTTVTGAASGAGFEVSSRTGKAKSQASAQECLLPFAYWNPTHLAAQRRLLDQGTGRIEAVSIATLGASTIPVRGNSTSVTGLRITGLKHPIDVWYAAGNRWVGLDTTVEGGRKLTYRLP